MLALFIAGFLMWQVPQEPEPKQTKETLIKNTETTQLDSMQGRFVEVANILIVGNKKTKERIILREIDVRVGRKMFYEDLLELLKLDENKIFNTNLFNSVTSKIFPRRGDKVDIVFVVNERWYTWPAPIFELADRNFNDWWTVRNRDINRVNFGLLLDKYNMRGLNESMSFLAQFGFTRRYMVKYRMPYINKAQTWGLNMAFGYDENDAIGYTTDDNQLQFISAREEEAITNRVLQSTYIAELGITFRESFYNFHEFGISFRQQQIADTIAALNPYFFLDGASQQQMFKLHYIFRRDLRDRRNYPLNGFVLDARVERFGLGIFNDVNFTSATFHYGHYKSLGKGLFLASSFSAYGSTTEGQPFNFYNALGYNIRMLKGYELYLIQGQSYLLHKNELKQRLFDTKLDMSVVFPFLPKQFSIVPMSSYFKLFFDHGYVQNNFPGYEGNQRLINRYLFSYGAGLDIVSFYDLVFRTEYAFTREGEHGIFFHFRYGL